jgi:hypothetical protein
MFLVGPKVFSFVVKGVSHILRGSIFTTHILCRVLAAIFKMADISKILKMQNCSYNGDLSLSNFMSLSLSI